MFLKKVVNSHRFIDFSIMYDIMMFPISEFLGVLSRVAQVPSHILECFTCQSKGIYLFSEFDHIWGNKIEPIFVFCLCTYEYLLTYFIVLI